MIKPYNDNSSKKSEVRAMFNNIARNYDFLNHFLSFGIDIIWRKRLIRELMKFKPDIVLDMATGTGDLAIMASRAGTPKTIGIDLSSEMIAVGLDKIKHKKLNNQVELLVGDAENIEFENNTFDAAMVAFGVRNFEDLQKGLSEINRVLKPLQPLFVLEFSKPRVFPVKQLYHFYSFSLLPLIGRMISKDPRAYQYLPESIQAFPSGNEFLEVMRTCNFENCRQIPLSFRIATLYIGQKKCE